MSRKTSKLFLLVFSLSLFLAVSPTFAQEKQLYWARWDADIALNKDGSFDVVETQEIEFTSGSFRFGTRNIPTTRLSYIDNVQVIADGQTLRAASGGETPGTFVVSSGGGELNIKWFFPRAVSDSRHVYIIKYTVYGGLRYYDGGDQFWWVAVGPERSFPVRASTVKVHVPEPATVTNYDNYGVRGTAKQLDPQTVEFTASESIPSDQEFEVRAQFTHGIVAGTPSFWQQEADAEAADKERQAAYDRQWRPLVNLGFVALGILLLIGGPLLVYLLWYQRGRDLPVALPTDYLPEPPDAKLPPGIAGTLVDETADMEDIIATLVDLAKRGVITIEEGDDDFTYRLVGQTENLRPFEKTLIDEIFTGKKQERRLSSLKYKFYKAIPKIKNQLYAEVVTEGFFQANPESTRNNYGALGLALLVLAGIFGCCIVPVLAMFTDTAILVAIGGGITAFAFMIVARYMPRKTAAGAEASARWRAFKRYLQEIEKYTNLEESKAIFETYLPFAVAFGLDRTWINKFAAVDAPVPTWWIPYPSSSYGHGPVVTTRGDLPDMTGGEGRSAPTLSDMSRGLGGGLSAMSAGFGTMLSSAASTFNSRSAPSSSSGSSSSGWSGGGGGWSGGGGFSGGGGGGGGGGFG